jgi:CheY-like chemotaxis protein
MIINHQNRDVRHKTAFVQLVNLATSRRRCSGADTQSGGDTLTEIKKTSNRVLTPILAPTLAAPTKTITLPGATNIMPDKFILLVEDDPNDVVLIQRAFAKAGMKECLRIARDGQEAIDYLNGSGQYASRSSFPMPFLILLDLKMPGVDGFQVLDWVRSSPEVKRTLVVVLTSSNLQADVDRAYELGANSYLVKPVEFEEMASMVQRFEIYWSEINRMPTTPMGDRLSTPESIMP